MAQWWNKLWSKVMLKLHFSQDLAILQSILPKNWQVKLSLKMVDLTGRFLDQMCPKIKLKSIILLGRVIMMHTVLVARSVLHNQFFSCIKTGGRLTSSRKWPIKHQKETWQTVQLDQFFRGEMKGSRLISMLFLNLKAQRCYLVEYHWKVTVSQLATDLMSQLQSRYHWDISEAKRREICCALNSLDHSRL